MTSGTKNHSDVSVGLGSSETQASAGSDTGYGMSIDSSNPVTLVNHTTPTTSPLTQHNEAVDDAPDESSDAAYEPQELGSAPSPESDLYDDDSNAQPAPTSNGASVPTNISDDNHEQYPDPASTSTTSNAEMGGVNLQALLENISASVLGSVVRPGHETTRETTSPEPTAVVDTSLSVPALNAAKPPAPFPLAAANLPPRPPPQENATNSSLDSDIRSYHLHDQPAFTIKNPPHIGTNLRPPGNVPPPVSTVGAPGTAPGANSLPPLPLATFQQRQGSPSTPSTYRQRDQLERRESVGDKSIEDEEIQWGPDVQAVYDEFLAAERSYVTQGEWEKFPPNSRMFIGKSITTTHGRAIHN